MTYYSAIPDQHPSKITITPSILDMNELDIIEGIYRDATQPVARLDNLAIDLQHWYLAFPSNNYLQPCLIDGKASLVCQKQLSKLAPQAYQAIKAICLIYDIYLKEDARSPNENPNIVHCRRKMAVVLTFCVGLMAGSELASANGKTFTHASMSGSHVSPETPALRISQVIKNQTLSEVALRISNQTGIHFKFNAAVESDLINKNLVAQDWNNALNQLLVGYNYTIIQERNEIKTVFITGYKGGVKPTLDATIDTLPDDLALSTDSQNDILEETSDNRVLIDIEIPTDQLADLPEGGDMTVDLPVGAFNIKQENMVDSEDGTLSWVGTMEGGNNIYRLYLAKTLEGDVVGNVYTPDGAYNIETINGQTVMIEIDQISMR